MVPDTEMGKKEGEAGRTREEFQMFHFGRIKFKKPETSRQEYVKETSAEDKLRSHRHTSP